MNAARAVFVNQTPFSLWVVYLIITSFKVVIFKLILVHTTVLPWKFLTGQIRYFYNFQKVLSHKKLQSIFLWWIPYPLPDADLGNTMGWVSALASGTLVTIRDYFSASLVWLIFFVSSRFLLATVPDPFPWWFPVYICAPITKVSPKRKSEYSLLNVAWYYVSQSEFSGTPALFNVTQSTPKGCIGQVNMGKQTLSLEILKTREYVRALSSCEENLISGV